MDCENHHVPIKNCSYFDYGKLSKLTINVVCGLISSLSGILVCGAGSILNFLLGMLSSILEIVLGVLGCVVDFLADLASMVSSGA